MYTYTRDVHLLHRSEMGKADLPCWPTLSLMACPSIRKSVGNVAYTTLHMGYTRLQNCQHFVHVLSSSHLYALEMPNPLRTTHDLYTSTLPECSVVHASWPPPCALSRLVLLNIFTHCLFLPLALPESGDS